MTILDRRAMIRAACAGIVVGLTARVRPAQASLVRGLALADLVRRSRSVCVAQLLDASCHWEEIGGRRLIVTDSSVEILDVVAKEAPSRRRIVVRSLGGRVGRVAQLVAGQARFDWDVASVMFLTARDDRYYVAGLAQGHYPLKDAAVPRLTASPDLPEILNVRTSAVERLVGQTLPGARALITHAMEP